MVEVRTYSYFKVNELARYLEQALPEFMLKAHEKFLLAK